MKFKDVFWVFLISMIPVFELRGAIPIGAATGLPFYLNYALAVVGNLIPVPFILLLIPHVLNIMEKFKIFRPIVQWIRRLAVKNSKKINSESQDCGNANEVCGLEANSECTRPQSAAENKMPKGSFIGLLLFVLLPIPGTGAWTGSLVASLFNFPKLKSLLAITLGVLGCGVIMCLASYGVLGFLSFLL